MFKNNPFRVKGTTPLISKDAINLTLDRDTSDEATDFLIYFGLLVSFLIDFTGRWWNY